VTNIRALGTSVLSIVYPSLIYGLPSVVIWGGHQSLQGILAGVWIGVAPLSFATLFAVTAGLLSRLHVHAIKAGRFPRQLSHPTYSHRRLYGTCWTTLYYCKPIYFLVLSFPWLKQLVFRLFGYGGSLKFTIYPDTWIRDLPLLSLGTGSYIANRATLGTNMALANGTILVAPITIGEQAIVGHLAVLACGVSVGDHSEIGACAVIGINVKISPYASVSADVTLEHGVRVGHRASVQTCARVGLRASIDDHEIVDFGAVVPPRRASMRQTSEETADAST
jgi:carbonic anhydrase/acetyltransferase-like protein (isoleucine patch superfamily)